MWGEKACKHVKEEPCTLQHPLQPPTQLLGNLTPPSCFETLGSCTFLKGLIDLAETDAPSLVARAGSAEL